MYEIGQTDFNQIFFKVIVKRDQGHAKTTTSTCLEHTQIIMCHNVKEDL